MARIITEDGTVITTVPDGSARSEPYRGGMSPALPLARGYGWKNQRNKPVRYTQDVPHPCAIATSNNGNKTP